MRRLKSLATLITSCAVDERRPLVALEDIESGTGRLVANVTLAPQRAPSAGVASAEPGDVLFAKLRPYLAKTWLVDRPVFASTELLCLRPTSAIDNRWFSYLCSSAPVVRWGLVTSDGTKMPRTSWEKLGEFRLDLPTVGEQRAVGSYLDAETCRTDTLIEKKRRMSDLLRERTRVARERLVSDGWRAGGPMRLGYLLREVDDRLGEAEPPPLLSVSIHSGVIPFAEANPDRIPRADDLANYKRCRRDDIILNRMRAFQGGIGRAPSDGVVSPDYAVLRPSDMGLADYLHHLLRSPWFVGQMQQRLRGIGGADQGNVRTPRVNWDDLRTVVVPSPPLNAQRRLAERLDAELEDTRKIEKVIERQLLALQEHRQTLITAAVVGELDVPQAT